jgi:uncharacterized damage-inducible protein DinB
MRIIEGLLQELDQEAHTTRRVLERVPQAHLAWKPHEKSMTLGQLAMHIAVVPGAVAAGAAQPAVQRPAFAQPELSDVGELLPLLDASVARARTLLGHFSDEEMQATWRLMDGERTLLALPRAAFVRNVMLNHWYHHRGQLSVYLRQLGVPLPSIYGPSADENPFAAVPAAATA